MHITHAIHCFRHSTRSASYAAPMAHQFEMTHSQSVQSVIRLNPRAYDSSLHFPTATERHVYPTVLERPPLPMRTAIRPLLPASAFTPRLKPPGIGSGKLRSVPSGCAVCPPVLALHSPCYRLQPVCSLLRMFAACVESRCASSIVSSMHCCAF